MNTTCQTKTSISCARVFVLALAIIVICATQTGCSKSEKAGAVKRTDEIVPVQIAKVQTIPLDRTIPVVGTLFPKDEATVSAEVEGRVEETRAEMGDQVGSAQLLARVDTTTYEAMLKKAAAALVKAEASAANAEQNLKREQELQKGGVASSSQLDQAIADASQWRAEVKSADASQAVAQLNLEHSRVKSPFDAAIAERLVSAGDYVKVGTPLFRIVNDSVLKFICAVPERSAGKVKQGQKIVFEIDAMPGEKFEGDVYLISPSINTITRNFSVGALVRNDKRKLKANSFGRGELILERKVQVPAVPLDAVVVFSGISKVFVIRDGKSYAKNVQTGRIADELQEIVRGLNPGETVAVTGTRKLRDGGSVKIVEASGKKG